MSARLRSCPGKPGEVVCRIALEENASYIVIGTRGGSSTLKRTVLGAVSDDIMRHAPCPVLVCRAVAEVERHRRRHMSAADVGETTKTVTRRRRSASGGDKVQRKSSDAFTSFASSLRRRFSSGGSSSRVARSFDCTGSDEVFETSTVLYSGSTLHDPQLEQHEMKTSAYTVSEEIHQATVEQ